MKGMSKQVLLVAAGVLLAHTIKAKFPQIRQITG